MLKCVLLVLGAVVLVSHTQAASKDGKPPTIKSTKTPTVEKSIKPVSAPGAKTSTKHAVHGATHSAGPASKSIMPSPTKAPSMTKTPVMPRGAKMMKAKAIVPSSADGGGGAGATTPGETKLPETSAFERGHRRRELDAAFGDRQSLMFEDIVYGVDFGGADGGGPMTPGKLGDERFAPGTPLGGLGGANPAAQGTGEGGDPPCPSDPPQSDPTDPPSDPPEPEPPSGGGDDVRGVGNGRQIRDSGIGQAASSPVPPTPIGDPDPPKPEESWVGRSGEDALGPQPEPPEANTPGSAHGGGGLRDSGIGKAAQTPPRPRPRNPDPPPDDEMTAAGGAQAARLHGVGGVDDGFREDPTTQPGGGDGDGPGDDGPGDFRKEPEGRKMPFGRVIQDPLAGPDGTIDPRTQPGPDGPNPTIMRSRPNAPLDRRLQNTDPASGAGGSALEP